MFERVRQLARALWVVAVPISLLAGFVLVMTIPEAAQNHFRGEYLYGMCAVLIIFLFAVLHGVVAFCLQRKMRWAATAAMVLGYVWLTFGLFMVALSLLVPPMLVGLLVVWGGIWATVLAGKARREIIEDDGWSRDGPLLDSKGFTVLVANPEAPLITPFATPHEPERSA